MEGYLEIVGYDSEEIYCRFCSVGHHHLAS
jgi:hypothetical protein